MIVMLALAVTSAAPEAANWRPPELRVADRKPIEDFKELQEIALAYLGRPYVWGGTGRPGYDCSGFTCRVFAEAGYAIPRVSRDQARSGRSVDIDSIRQGDLLFFAEPGGPVSHVGLYLGDRLMVHASSGQGEVVVASVDQTWFRQNLLGARRILGEEAALLPDGAISSLVEHTGSTALPMVRRVSERRALPPLGPSFYWRRRTFAGARLGVVTEAGRAAAVVVPELGINISPWALSVGLGLPVRLDVDGGADIGATRGFADATRFLRELRVGLPGADFALALERQGVYRVGRLVRGHAPFVGFDGVPGASIRPSPLTLSGGLRIEPVDVRVYVDDVTQPDVIAGSVTLERGLWTLTTGYGLEEDDGTHHLQGGLEYGLMRRRAFELDLGIDSGARAEGGRLGGALFAHAEVEQRFGRRLDGRWGLEARLGFVTRRFVIDPLGPTQPIESARQALVDAAEAAGPRPWVGGATSLQLGGFSSELRFGQGLRARGDREDRVADLAVGLDALSLGRDRKLRFFAGVRSRRPFSRPLFAAWGSLEVQFARWASLSLYALHGRTWEGGGALGIHWAR